MTALLLASAGLAAVFFPNAAFAGTRHAVTIEGMRYSPESVEVRPGDVISWTNQDPFPHTVTFEGPGSDSKEIPAAGKWMMTAPAKGRYAYRCALHPTMHGVLVVK
jgi:plastocyanin